ncbi:hypothetical protein RAZWK3B_04600 [Roseobacter sp. AzwK-3b]|nr:hypothetical protein RAZWK3B_04600 [Roseobacter sp. AzwK-3b]
MLRNCFIRQKDIGLGAAVQWNLATDTHKAPNFS